MRSRATNETWSGLCMGSERVVGVRLSSENWLEEGEFHDTSEIDNE